MLDTDFIPPDRHKDNAIARFYVKQKKHNYKSAEAGHSVFEAKDYVKILLPGDRLTEVDREVQDADKMRWPQAYAAFKANQEYIPDGTPLSEWPPMDAGQCEHFKHFNVHTVEQLAKLSDSNIQAIGLGARELVTKATLWLARANDGAAVSKLVHKNEQQASQIEALQKQVGELAALATQAKASADGAPSPVAVAPAAGLSAEQIAAIVSQQVAAALAAAAPPKNKGGRPRKEAEAEEPAKAEADAA